MILIFAIFFKKMPMRDPNWDHLTSAGVRLASDSARSKPCGDSCMNANFYQSQPMFLPVFSDDRTGCFPGRGRYFRRDSCRSGWVFLPVGTGVFARVLAIRLAGVVAGVFAGRRVGEMGRRNGRRNGRPTDRRKMCEL